MSCDDPLIGLLWVWTSGKGTLNSGSFHSPIMFSSTFSLLFLSSLLLFSFLLITLARVFSVGRRPDNEKHWRIRFGDFEGLCSVSWSCRSVGECTAIWILSGLREKGFTNIVSEKNGGTLQICSS